MDRVSKESIEQRAKLIEAMDLIVHSLNDEDCMDMWLETGVPDSGGKEEYLSIAEDINDIVFSDGTKDNSVYEDCIRTFVKCIIYYANGGFWCGDMLGQTMSTEKYVKMLRRAADIIENDDE